MEHRDEQPESGRAPPAGDFERLIRWSLEDAYAEAEPSSKVWSQVLARVKDGEASAGPSRPKSRRAALPLASLVQAAVIGVLLLAFGFGGDQGVVLPGSEYAISSTPIRQKRIQQEEFPADSLRRYILLKMEREQARVSQRSSLAAGLDKGW